MTVAYKVWIQVERCDDARDDYRNVTDEILAAEFDGRGAAARARRIVSDVLRLGYGELPPRGSITLRR